MLIKTQDDQFVVSMLRRNPVVLSSWGKFINMTIDLDPESYEGKRFMEILRSYEQKEAKESTHKGGSFELEDNV